MRTAIIFLIASLVCVSGFGDNELSRGKFLIATPKLNDPRFTQAVILLIRYDTQGTAGLIINLPTKIPASKAFPGANGFSNNDLLYLGGPVDRNQFCLLIQSWTAPVEETVKVVENVYVASNEDVIKKAVAKRKSIDRLRFYVGYAGWSPGQLETEIAGGYWLIYRGNADSIFDKNPSHLWQDLLDKASVMQAFLPNPSAATAR